MDSDKNCQGCDQQNDCQQLYEKLGSQKGPSVALGVIFAFLLPLVLFSASVAILEHYLGWIDHSALRILISFTLSLGIIVVYIVFVNMYRSKHKQQKKF